jgi:hypothetical protein
VTAGLPLRLWPQEFAVCQLDPQTNFPEPPQVSKFWALTITDRERSLVCETKDQPAGAICEPGWRLIEVVGVLDFSLVGVIAGLSQTLAAAGISIFTISTYETDYLLVRAALVSDACRALEAAGNHFIDQAKSKNEDSIEDEL